MRQVCTSWGSPLDDKCEHLFYSIIDVRTIPEMQPCINKKILLSSSILFNYRNLRNVVNLVGGWEKYRKLPEIDLNDSTFDKLRKYSNIESIDLIKSSDLCKLIFRVKGYLGIYFCHYCTYGGSIKRLGHIILPPSSTDIWSFNFGFSSPIVMKKENKLGQYTSSKIDLTQEDQFTDLISKPLQVLKELFSRP